MNPTPVRALRQRYADLTKVANDLGIINFLMTETGGKLQVTGTAAYQLAKDELWNAIGSLLDAVTSTECQNYILNSGYEFV